jgi:peptidoglycan biosynthesis protein MviN/MurJ (putative lipid II flippase)
VELLLKRGNFTSQDVATTASVLRALAAGLFVVTASNMLGRVICVVGKVRQYAASWLIAVAFFLLLLLLNEQTPQARDLSRLGGTLSLAYGFHSALVFLLLVRELPGSRLRTAIWFSGRLALAMLASGKASEWIARLGTQGLLFDHPTMRLLTGLILGGLGGTGVFIALIWIMNGAELRIMMAVSRQIFATRRRVGMATRP